MYRRFLVLAGMAGCCAMAVDAHSEEAAESKPAWSFSLDALSWHTRSSPLGVPFVTTGVIGEAGTDVVFGPSRASFGSQSGARIVLGRSFSESKGIEFSVFGLEQGRFGDGMASDALDGSVHLYIPYIDPQNGHETATDFSVPYLYSGKADLRVTERLRGAELNLRWRLPWQSPVALDLLAGVTYLGLSESLTLETSSPLLDNWGPDIWQTHDAFSTRNRFYGLQAGLRASTQWRGGFYGSAELKIAAGQSRQNVNIQGWLQTNDYTYFEQPEQFPGGYFALPSNVGRHSRDRFALSSQGRVELGYRFSPNLSVHLAYSMLYATNTVRPGPHISRVIDTSQSTSYTEDPMSSPTPGAQPGFAFHDSTFRSGGVAAGITFSF